MALFKPYKGQRSGLDAVTKKNGNAYFCVDDGSFWIDYTDSNGSLQRKQINAKDAETLCGMTTGEIIAAVDIPDVAAFISTHNTSTSAHNDIRTAVSTAQSTANTAKTNAYNAQSAADTAKTNAATAQTTIDAHIANTSNPHKVTATQVGADPAGSAAAVQELLEAHEAASNPHSLTYSDVGADKSGAASTVQTNLDSHISASNPHKISTSTIGAVPTSRTVNGKALSANITLSASDVGADASGAAANALADAKSYTNTQIATLIGSADTTMDTLGEIADAMEENADVVEALDAAVGAKADATTVNSHISNTSNPHKVTAAQIGAATTTALDSVQTSLDSHTSNKSNPHGVTAAQAGAAPTSHASIATTYGIGTSSNYGHVKLSDSTSSTSAASSGIAASPKAVKTAYDLANTAKTNAATAQTTADTHIVATDNPHKVTAAQVGADASGTASSLVSSHNTNTSAHNDIRTAVSTAQSTADTAKTNAANAQTAIDTHTANSGIHVAFTTTVPKIAGTAAVGTATTVSRSDHVHPVQTSVSGNAGTATKLATSRTISLSGDVTGSTSFDGSANAAISATLASSGVTAGSYGPSANASPAHSGTFSVPYITVDAKGRVTSASTKTITLPSDNNTDTKVTQTVTTSNASYPLLLAPSGQTATATTTSYFDSGVTLNPSTNTIAANISGNAATATTASACSGNAATATKLATARTIQTNLGSTSSASFNGSANITPGVTGTLPIDNGGTGSTTAAGALTNLGLTATAAELNYCDGVTSNIQTQLNAKAASSHSHYDIAVRQLTANKTLAELGQGYNGIYRTGSYALTGVGYWRDIIKTSEAGSDGYALIGGPGASMQYVTFNSGTPSAVKTLLDSSNYTSYISSSGGGTVGMVREFDSGALSASTYTYSGQESKFYAVTIKASSGGYSTMMIDYRALSTTVVMYVAYFTNSYVGVNASINSSGYPTFTVNAGSGSIVRVCGYY